MNDIYLTILEQISVFSFHVHLILVEHFNEYCFYGLNLFIGCSFVDLAFGVSYIVNILTFEICWSSFRIERETPMSEIW